MKHWIKSFFLAILFLTSCTTLPSATPTSIATDAASPTPIAAPTETEPVVTPAAADPVQLPDQVILLATAKAELLLEMEAGSLALVSAEPVQWTTPCLGLPEAGEGCMEKTTDGYKLILAAQGHTYEIHTDQTGENVRILGMFPTKTPVAVRLALVDLASRLVNGASRIEITSYTAMEWPDACLGVVADGQMCAQVITPGYEATFLANGRVFIYHTDESGENVVLYQDGYGQSGMHNVLIVLDTTSPECTSVMISDEEVSSGACNSEIISHPLASTDHSVQVNWYADTYAPFELTIDGARLRFSGRGGQIASPAEQRAILEWARLTTAQAEAGQASPDAGLAAVIEKTGGFAGICRRVTLNLNGWYSVADCSAEQLRYISVRMTAMELQQLLDLYDRLGVSATTYSVPPNADDAYEYAINFYGNGSEPAAQADYDILQQLAR